MTDSHAAHSGGPATRQAQLTPTGTAAETGRHEHFMQLALAEARAAQAHGEVPIGAVVVKDGQVVATGHNWRETWRDPTAHAELIAIQEASRKLGGWRLSECDLYVTLEPCPMCAGAIMLARVRHLYFGAFDEKGGAVGSKMQVLDDGVWNHHPNITGGILDKECGMILKDFFKAIRLKQTIRRDV